VHAGGVGRRVQPARSGQPEFLFGEVPFELLEDPARKFRAFARKGVVAIFSRFQFLPDEAKDVGPAFVRLDLKLFHVSAPIWDVGPRPATGDGLGLQHQVVFVRWGGLPETRPMRGDIDGLLSAACMGVGRSLQACCATRGLLAGRSAPERCDPDGCSPALTHFRQWIGWQAGRDRRFWPHMTQRCADQDDLEHGVLRLCAGGRL